LAREFAREVVPRDVAPRHHESATREAYSLFVVAHERRDRFGEVIDAARIVDDYARLSVSHGVVTAARSPSHLGKAAGRRFDEDNAEALLFEAEPPTPTVHHHQIACGDPPRLLSLVDVTEKRHGRVKFVRETLETCAIATVTANEDAKVRELAAQLSARANESVEAFTWYET
jgi:hypothetical protein